MAFIFYNPISLLAAYDNFVLSSLMLLIGHILDDVIIVLTTPVGIVFAFSAVIFFEQSTIKSIAKDWNASTLSYAKCKVKKFIGLGGVQKYC